MTDDLGALLDVAVDALLAVARRNTGIALPSHVTFVVRPPGLEKPRCAASRAEALALVAATRVGPAYARIVVTVLGIHDGKTVIELAETPSAAFPPNVFRVGGVKVAGSSPITLARLEAGGLEAVEACER